jgi:hypothetical protein
MLSKKRPLVFLQGAATLAITIALVGLFLHDFNKEELFKIVLGAKPWPLLAAGAVFAGITALRAARFALLKKDLPFFLIFGIAAVHTALLRVMPFRSGEMTIGVLYRITRLGSIGEGLFAVVFVRILDAIVITVMAVTGASVLFLGRGGLPETWLWGLGFLALAAVAALFFGSSLPCLRSLPEKSAALSKRNVLRKALDLVGQAEQLPLPRKLLLLLSTLILWPLVIVWFCFIMLGIGVALPLSDMIRVATLGIVGSILPLSILGSFGPMEGSLAMAFHHAGLAPETAIACGVTLSLWTFIHSWLLAIPSAVFILARRKKQQQAVSSG